MLAMPWMESGHSMDEESDLSHAQHLQYKLYDYGEEFELYYILLTCEVVTVCKIHRHCLTLRNIVNS